METNIDDKNQKPPPWFNRDNSSFFDRPNGTQMKLVCIIMFVLALSLVGILLITYAFYVIGGSKNKLTMNVKG